MTEVKFNELWEQIGNTAQDIVNTCKDGISFNNEKRMYVEFEYNKFRDALKAKHMTPSDTEPIRLDRHKIASCIAGAILSTKPIEYVEQVGSSDKSKTRMFYLANETLALFSALAITKSFIRSDDKNEIGYDAQFKDVFLREGYKLPKPKHDQYIPWLLFLLQDSAALGFNVLAFSNILYLLEVYTFSQIELEAKSQN